MTLYGYGALIDAGRQASRLLSLFEKIFSPHIILCSAIMYFQSDFSISMAQEALIFICYIAVSMSLLVMILRLR